MTQQNEANFQGQLQAALVDDPDFLRELVRDVLQKFLEAEFSSFLGAEPHQRTETRKGYRCGFYERHLIMRIGRIELRIPRDRDGRFSSELFERFQRSEKALVLAIMESYIQGVATRRLKKITVELCGVGFSKSHVSDLVASLDEDLKAWRERPLNRHYSVVYIDGLYSKVRERPRVVSQCALLALGILPDGTREALGTSVVHAENEADYVAFLEDLKRRGIRRVDIIVSDAHEGLKAAIARVFPSSAWQRCLFHFMQNLTGKCPKRHRKEIHARLRSALRLANKGDAERAILTLAAEVSSWSQNLADWLESAAPEITAHMEFPEGLWPRIRSNNLLERFNRELRRRVRLVGIFSNSASLLRLITAMTVEQDEEWRNERRYLNPELLEMLPLRKAG